MTNIKVDRLLKNNKSLLLAYDHGMEHGPKDLNLETVDPKLIFDIALEGRYNGVIVQHGIAEKYYLDYYREIPLIIKLNGKSSLTNIAPVSRQVCSVERAIKLGASAVGYTIYPGSPEEPTMFHEFAKIVETAHDYGMPVILWMYPRGSGINEMNTDVIAYAARLGLELGADFLKLKYNDDIPGYQWIAKCAGKTRVLIAGGDKLPEEEFFSKVESMMKAGITGLAVGRNVWQHEKPFTITKALQKIIFEGKSAEEAIKFFREHEQK